MHELDDHALLRQFAEHNSEVAFAALVARHVDKVYSTALRHTRSAHAAEEITQAVFVILAKKSGRLGAKVILAGWLYETARLTALTHIRSEIRRARREQEAHMQTALNRGGDASSPFTPDTVWPHIAPLLDDALAGLSAADRHAVVLRYFDGKSLGEVGAALGASEDAAKKRVTRAVEKLRGWFTKRGVTLTATVLTAAISANSVQAAPLGLAATVTATAVKGAVVSGSTLTLIKGALKIMAWTKIKTAVVVGVGVLLAAGTTTITIRQIQEHRTYPWQAGDGGTFDPDVLNRQPPQVRVLASRFTNSAEGFWNNKAMGTGLPAQEVVAVAYGASSPRTIFSAKLPAGKYDFIACLPSGNLEALQNEVKRKFGVAGKIETREMDVWLLKVKSSKVAGLMRSTRSNEYMMWKDSGNRLEFRSRPLSELASELEFMANVPVLERTSLTNSFDFDLKCNQADLVNRNWDSINEALDQLELELVPSRESIKMLVVEKVK